MPNLKGMTFSPSSVSCWNFFLLPSLCYVLFFHSDKIVCGLPSESISRIVLETKHPKKGPLVSPVLASIWRWILIGGTALFMLENLAFKNAYEGLQSTVGAW